MAKQVDRRGRRPAAVTSVHSSARYTGAAPVNERWTRVDILKSTRWRDVLTPPDFGDETLGGVLKRLQAAHQTICYAEVQRVAVIQPSIDESLHQGFDGVLRQASNKRTQLPELVIASTTLG